MKPWLTVRTLLRLAAAAAATVTALMTPVTAGGTPAHGISGDVLSQTTLDGRDHILREITIAPGGSTGWHWHAGTLFGVIRQGTLTHDLADCSVDGVYSTGDPIAEPGGPGHAHIGRNLGSTPVVLEVVYINPAGSPLSQDAPDPGCGYS